MLSAKRKKKSLKFPRHYYGDGDGVHDGREFVAAAMAYGGRRDAAKAEKIKIASGFNVY